MNLPKSKPQTLNLQTFGTLNHRLQLPLTFLAVLYFTIPYARNAAQELANINHKLPQEYKVIINH